MEIRIIFERAFQDDVRGAVWIVDSPKNREWFEQQAGLDRQSAVFVPEGGETGRDAILRSIWNVQEHYQSWSQIILSGASLTPDIATVLQDEGILKETINGFSLTRQ